MIKIPRPTIIIIFTASLVLSAYTYALSLTTPEPKKDTNEILDSELKRYFEKAMRLYEKGQYKEAIEAFESIIELERKEGRLYFTNFSEIYIEKAKARMKELVVLDEKKWDRLKEEIMKEEKTSLEEEEARIPKVVEDEVVRQERARMKALEDAYNIMKELKDLYEEAIDYYKKGSYELAIESFNKLKELDAGGKLVPEAETFIEKAKEEIKREERARLEEERLKMEEERHLIKLENERFLRELERKKEELAASKRKEEDELLQQRVRVAYDEGLKYYSEKDYQKAIESFGRIRELNPGHDLVARADYFIEKAEEEIKKKKEQEIIARDIEREKIALENNEREKMREIVELVRSLYQEALGYYKNKDYSKAIERFKKIKELDPGGKLVSKTDYFIAKVEEAKQKKEEEDRILREAEKERLAIQQKYESMKGELEWVLREKEREIAEDDAKRSKERELENEVIEIYNQALTKYYREKDYSGAIELFAKVKALAPTRDIASRAEYFIENANRWIRMQEDVQKEAERLREEAKLDMTRQEGILYQEGEEKRLSELVNRQRALYEEALRYYSERDYLKAIEMFNRVKEIDPDSKLAFRAESFIENAREEMAKQKAVEEAKVIAERETVQMKLGEGEEEMPKSIFDTAMGYYINGDFPRAIAEFNKLKEMAPPDTVWVSKAQYYIDKSQQSIKKREEQEVLARMESAKKAQIEAELENRRKRIKYERKEIEKQRLKQIFAKMYKKTMLEERAIKIEGYLATIREYVNERRFVEAEEKLDKIIQEFPENERFKDLLHFVQMQKIKADEKAVARAREIVEEKMLLEVAEAHMPPEQKTGSLEKQKKITPIVRVPEIRQKLKMPISVDFDEVELDYVLNFLSDTTGVNIIPSSQINMAEKKVKLKLKNVPLEQALHYILKSQNLFYRIEEDAVWVAAKEELDSEEIDTRVYFLNQGIGRFAEFSGTYTGDTSPQAEVRTVKDIIENAVDWPKDSKMTLDERTGALIISNIPSNLSTIENLLYNLDVTPKQILIEAKFLELTVSDVDDLGLEWKLNSAFPFQENNASQAKLGLASSSGVDFSAFSRASEGFNLTYKGILSHPQFQVVLHALQESQKVKNLSAPRITTLNNQTATIEVIDEYIYPTRYEVSLVQFDINGDGDFDDAGETEWANIPQDFVTRDVGILLHVKPSIGVDNKTITLSLTPEVSETSTSYTYEGSVSIPKFETRNLSTSVTVDSGQTVVLGGLIKESRTLVKTKVPLLGDVPFFGAFFRKKTDSVERKNLIIFVTATVLRDEDNALASAQAREGEI